MSHFCLDWKHTGTKNRSMHHRPGRHSSPGKRFLPTISASETSPPEAPTRFPWAHTSSCQADPFFNAIEIRSPPSQLKGRSHTILSRPFEPVIELLLLTQVLDSQTGLGGGARSEWCLEYQQACCYNAGSGKVILLFQSP